MGFQPDKFRRSGLAQGKYHFQHCYWLSFLNSTRMNTKLKLEAPWDEVKEKMKENKLIKSNLERNLKFPPYLAFDKQKLTIAFLRYPIEEEVKELNKNIDTDAVGG